MIQPLVYEEDEIVVATLRVVVWDNEESKAVVIVLLMDALMTTEAHVHEEGMRVQLQFHQPSTHTFDNFY